MKKILITIAAGLIAILAIVFIAPNFVDWNQYRDEITAQIKIITGRNLEIKGDIKISIIPTPVLAIKSIHLANSKGATDKNFLSLESLEVHLALAPLLTRNIQVKKLKLVDPILNIEIMSNGKDNLSFQLKNNKPKLKESDVEKVVSAPTKVNNKPIVAGFNVQIDNFLVENGTINYRDNLNKRLEKIKNLNGGFRLASLIGPMDAKGSAIFREIPISFSASLGQIVKERTLPFNIVTTIIPGDVKTSFGGTISNIKESPQVRGKITANGDNLGTFLSAITGNTRVPKLFAQPFSATANVTSNLKKLELKNFVMEFIGTKGVGSVEVTLGNNIDTNVLLSLNKLNLDAILLTSSGTPKTSVSNISAETSKTKQTTLRTPSTSVKKISPKVDLSSLPEAINANLNLSVASLIYKKSTIKNAKLNASMTNKEITLSQLSALLPGNTDIALFGFINQNQTGPVFDGTVDLVTNNLRGLLQWSGIKVPDFGKNGLKKLNFFSKLKTGNNFIQLSKMKLKLDETKIQGSTKLALTTRPSLTIGLTMDNLNVDSYFPEIKAQKKLSDNANQAISSGSNLAKNSKSKSRNKSDTKFFSTLGFINSLDTSLKTSVKSLTINGIRVSNLHLNASLGNGNLFIKNGSVGTIAGLQGKLSGRLSGLQTAHQLANPVFKDFKIELRGKSFSRFLKTMGIESPVSLNTLGAVRLNAILNGQINSLSIATNINMPKGTLKLKGLVQPFKNTPTISGKIGFFHSDLKTLLRAFNVSYSPITSKMKEIKLAGKLEASAKSLSLNKLAGKLVGLNLGGLVNIDFSGPRPAITANLTTSNINLNELFPQESVSLFFDGIYRKHAFKGHTSSPLYYKTSLPALSERATKPEDILYVAKNDTGRWSRLPIDLKYLNSFDADVVLKTPRIMFSRFKLDRFSVRGKLQNGNLDVQEAKGKLFEGDLKLSGTLKNNQYQTQFTLNRLNLPLALQSFQDQTLASGKMDFTGNLRTNGRSVADLVSNLSGAGSLSVTGLGISARVRQRSALAGITSLIASLNQFSSSLGGKHNPQKVNLKGRFQIVNGIAKFDNTTLTSGIGNGTASGIINLPKWQLNSKGSLNISQNVLMQLLMKQDAPNTIPFQISGLLDQPSVKLDTSSFSRKDLRIPGKLRKKFDKILGDKGIGNVLREMLPITPSKSTPKKSNPNRSSNPNPATKQNKPQQQLKPEEIFKNILRGLSR